MKGEGKIDNMMNQNKDKQIIVDEILLMAQKAQELENKDFREREARYCVDC